jgi:hypothetical protein
MNVDPIVVCYCVTLIFLLGVLAAMVFSPHEMRVMLFLKQTLRTYLIIVMLGISAGAISVLLWTHLRGK